MYEIIPYKEKARIKNDIAIILRYLKDSGYDFNVGENSSDSVCFRLTSYGKLRHLSFTIRRFSHKGHSKMGGLCNYYDYTNRQLIYDTDGNVLFNITKANQLDGFQDGRTIYQKGNSKDIFPNCCSVVLWGDGIRSEEMPATYYVRTFDGYQAVHVFDGESPKKDIPQCCFGDFVLKTSDKKVFINDYGRLYSLREKKYVNDLRFDSIHDCSSCYPYLCAFKYFEEDIKREILGAIMENIKNRAYLLAVTNVEVADEKGERNRMCSCLTFIDSKGNIVSPLFYNVCQEFRSMPVTTETYNWAIEQVKQILFCDIAREKECERRVAEYEKQSQLATLNALSGKTEGIIPYVIRPLSKNNQDLKGN